MKVNEHLLKVSAGKIVVDQELSIDADIAVLIKGSIVKYEDSSNQDGTVNRTYILKGMVAEYIKQ